MNWVKCVESFLRVVEAKSFAKASRLTHATPSALSKHVAWLEEELGIKLLQRTTRQLKLTDAGTLFYIRCKDFCNGWDDIKREVMEQSHEMHALIRIGARTSNQYIVTMITQFLTEYPQMSAELTLTNRRVDLMEENIDIFISHDNYFHHLHSLEAQPLRSTYRQVMAAPSYFRHFGEPKTPTELARHNCLVKTSGDNSNIWELNGKNYTVSGNFGSDNMNSLIAAAANGFGLIWAPLLLVVNELKKKQLKITLPNYRSSEVKTFAYFLKHRFIPQKTSVFLQFLSKHMSSL